MRKPLVFTGDYWRGEWAGVKAAKYHVALFIVAFLSMQNSIRNNGFVQLVIPGTEYAVYYFGFDPAIWGFLTGFFFLLSYGKVRVAARQRRKELWYKHVAELPREPDPDPGDPHANTRAGPDPTTGG